MPILEMRRTSLLKHVWLKCGTYTTASQHNINLHMNYNTDRHIRTRLHAHKTQCKEISSSNCAFGVSLYSSLNDREGVLVLHQSNALHICIGTICMNWIQRLKVST